MGVNLGLASGANTLYASDAGNDDVRVFNASTGTATTPNTISGGVITPRGLALSDDNSRLYVANNVDDTVRAYSSSSGQQISGFTPPRSTNGVDNPNDVAVSGNTLFVANGTTNNGQINTYNATTGARTNNNNPLVTITSGSFQYITVTAAMPEPASLALLAVGLLPLAGLVMRRRSNITNVCHHDKSCV